MKKLTERMIEALRAAEDTLYGDVKMVFGYGRSLRGLKERGLVEGTTEHAYLTDAGKAEKNALHA